MAAASHDMAIDTEAKDSVNDIHVYLRGFLGGFEMLNEGVNHSCTYTLNAIERAGSIDDDLRAYFDNKIGSFELEPIESWPEFMAPIADRWLFDFADRHGRDSSSGNARRSPVVGATSRSNVAHTFMWHLKALVEPCKVWRIKVATHPSHDLVWDDVLFERGSTLYLLHFGAVD